MLTDSSSIPPLNLLTVKLAFDNKGVTHQMEQRFEHCTIVSVNNLYKGRAIVIKG